MINLLDKYGDTIVASGAVVFAVALLPQLWDAYHGKPMNYTSATMTGVILLIYCAVYAAKGMWLAAIPITSIVWLLIAYFSWRNRT